LTLANSLFSNSPLPWIFPNRFGYFYLVFSNSVNSNSLLFRIKYIFLLSKIHSYKDFPIKIWHS
jgi:hypothetical protein